MARFAAAGWHVTQVNGHDPEAVFTASQAAKNDPRPSDDRLPHREFGFAALKQTRQGKLPRLATWRQ
jgi:hypothetical protein